ncbi:NADH-quinone oxidoreductase subunit NuoE [Mycobacterium sp. SMC-4]|uniref:NADH-quinone oxidoreductase subunit NuoE n=1 Tax=Mycobacterium sp. SMC-4 TaxID=2857059 RepID=UPI003D014BE2
MSIFLELGQRPDEPGPPIHGPARYSPEVTSRLQADATTIVDRYPHPRSALLPLLHLVQSEDGCLTPAGIAFCAERLGLTGAEVAAVATFYSMYRRTPTGDYLVGVCTNTLCAVMGGDAILEELRRHLDIDVGATTPDGAVTLEHVECNAACDYAPVVMVNWDFFDNQTPSSARELVDALRTGTPPQPSRSPSLCTFRQTARILAGLEDPEFGDAAVGAATLAGLRYARGHHMTAPTAQPTDTTTTSAEQDRVVAADAVRDQAAPGPSAHVPPRPSTPDADPDVTGRP